MRNLFSDKPLSDVSTDDLKKQGQLLQAITYVAAFFIVANIGYAIFRLVSHKVDSVSELAGGNLFSMGGFGASLLICSYLLKKIKAEIIMREANK
ncbi:hypothetical protein [Fibrella forsythiae]|uniref:Uncharacterized protein n=1 Tax=Fibrella forsythiae TaxID=2817061 RepID=A0ABS3JID0_9BACT|nr:hypothetical protein [Fibrella forsythiae]MBO0949770.1 hypothetical protein [Fibrella forsythiae]